MKNNRFCLILLFLVSLLACNLRSNRNICDDENEIDYRESVSHFKKEIDANPKHEKSIYHLGMSHYKLGEFKDAEIAFTNLININSDYPAAYLNRGLCRFFQSDHSGACEDFKSSIMIGYDPNVINDKKISEYVEGNCAS